MQDTVLLRVPNLLLVVHAKQGPGPRRGAQRHPPRPLLQGAGQRRVLPGAGEEPDRGREKQGPQQGVVRGRPVLVEVQEQVARAGNEEVRGRVQALGRAQGGAGFWRENERKFVLCFVVRSLKQTA